MFSSLSQTGLHFRDCNHIVEFVFVEFISATYRLSSKKTRKGKSPGKGGNRFWKFIVVGLKTPREAIEGDFFVFFSRCQALLLIVFCVLDCVFERMIADLVFTYNHYFRKANCVPLHPRDLVGLKVTSP
ncbi:hypothetical protein HKD37_10G028554 [Glycine soja]